MTTAECDNVFFFRRDDEGRFRLDRACFAPDDVPVSDTTATVRTPLPISSELGVFRLLKDDAIELIQRQGQYARGCNRLVTSNVC